MKHGNYNNLLKSIVNLKDVAFLDTPLDVKAAKAIPIGPDTPKSDISSVANSGYQYKYNGKEYQDELELNMYDYGARNYDPALGRFMTMDPLSEKFFPLTPYNYVANSPILLIDPNGEDWTINRTEDKSGRVHYQINYTGAILNSSSKKVNMVDFAKSIEKQVESLMTNFESREDGSFDFAVTTNVSLRIIDDKEDVKSDESLIEIKDGTDKDFTSVYPKGSKITVVGREMNGKEVSVNADYVDGMISGKNKKTMTHELGHTLGLKHPLMDTKRIGFSLLPGSTYYSPKTNFMYQGTVKSPTGPTREQMSRIYQLYVNNQLNRKDVQPVNVNTD